MEDNTKQICPLCNTHQQVFFHQDNRREYTRCLSCELVFVPKKFHLSESAEKNEYDKHNNQIHDQGYRKFLSRLYLPITEILLAPATILDFGCGPGPALAAMFEEKGYIVNVYDKYYFPKKSVLDDTYDCITSTEVFEHLKNPGVVINELVSILKPGGVLGIMTKLVKSQEAFSSWHYKNDPTHICFFSMATLIYISEQYGLSFRQVHDDAFIFTKAG